MSDSAGLFRLDGEVAVIAGAGSDFAPLIAEGLADAGADVALADLRAEKAQRIARLVEARGRRALAAGLDATRKGEVDHFIAETEPRARPSHGAGQPDRRTRGEGRFRDLRRRCVLAHDRYRRTLLPALRRRRYGGTMSVAGHGSIVHFASTAGLQGQQHQPAYSAAKGALVQLTRTLALDWAPQIRVNAIAPTMFDTEGLRQVREGRPELGLPPAPPGYLDRAIARIPLGRIGRPEEIVGPVLFLATRASSMVTGAVLMVDGGVTAGPVCGGQPTLTTCKESDMDKVVTLTGAAGGLGRAMAEGLAQAGYAVVLIDRDRASLEAMVHALRMQGRRAAAIAWDLSDDSGMEQLAHAMAQPFGPTDILVNNAGLGLNYIRNDFVQRPIKFWEVDAGTSRPLLRRQWHDALSAGLRSRSRHDCPRLWPHRQCHDQPGFDDPPRLRTLWRHQGLARGAQRHHGGRSGGNGRDGGTCSFPAARQIRR